MPATTDGISQMAAPVVTALATVNAVSGIVCFGSYALGTADAESDLDLYVICEPTVMPVATRHRLLTRLPGSTALHLQYTTPGWDNAWAPHADRVTVAPTVFDIVYTTCAWLTHVVHRVYTEGALTLPEMLFRPYTVLGLVAHAIPLYDPHGIVQRLRAQLSPYPAVLQANLLGEALPIMADGLAELHDYTRRNIGPSAFLLHLGRVCDAMVTVLYALNQHYDPATKRPEQALRHLAVLPERFVERFVRLLEGPFDLRSRPHIMDELTRLVGEVTHLAHRLRA
jgi:predicted nucleotidyltransferase